MLVKKTLMATAAAAVLSAPFAASAVTIDGITFAPGFTFVTSDLFEGDASTGGPITTPGQELGGVGIVNRILQGSTEVWGPSAGTNGRELTIVFDNYIAQDFNTAVIGGNSLDVINFSGGSIRVYSDSTPDFDSSTFATANATASDGNLWLDMVGSPVGGVGGFDNSPITLTSTGTRNGDTDPTGAFLSADNLSGAGNLDVVGGLAESNFDTDTTGCDASSSAPCPDIADVTFSSSGQLGPNVPGSGDYAFFGTGEIRTFPIPEPGTLALIGAGLVGVGARRRFAK